MKTALSRFWFTYMEGIRLLIMDAREELFAQLAYIGMIITEVSLLWIFGYGHAKEFTFMMVIHLIILYYYSWKRNYWKDSIIKEQYYRNTYWFLNGAILLITFGFTDYFSIFPLAIAPIAGTLSVFVLWTLLALIVVAIVNLNSVDEDSIVRIILFHIVNLLPVILSVAFLPIFWGWKVLIVGAYIVLSPLIVVGADNGMDFCEMISVLQ